MDYNHIKNYLEKFRTILFSKEENLRIISKIIEKNTLVIIEVKNISIRGAVIYIKASPLVRNEIMINKSNILKDIAFIIKEVNFLDIK